MKFDTKVRGLVISRAKGKCEKCGVPLNIGQLHHRRPRGMGGTNRVESGSPANAMFIDFKCHESIESNREDALIMGWLVSQHSEPSSVCVFFHDGWFMLDDMGGRTKIQRPSRVI